MGLELQPYSVAYGSNPFVRSWALGLLKPWPGPHTSTLDSKPIRHAILLCTSHDSLPETCPADASWSGTLLLGDALSWLLGIALENIAAEHPF